MNQVGDAKHFTVSSLPSGTNIYAFCWRWWDATAEATTAPAASKVVNIGGHPDSRELHYSCMAVAVDGQEVTSNGTFQANNPPTVLFPTISVNDSYLPYATRLGLYAFDLDTDSLLFLWFSGTNYLGSGSTDGNITTNGTWIGNAIVDVRSYTANENHLFLNVLSDRMVTCKVIDASFGTTEVDFDLRGFQRPSPPAGIIAMPSGILTSIVMLPIQRIYSGGYFDFEVVAKDVANGPLEFAWSFAGTNNWTVPEETRGTNTLLEDGSYRNTYRKSIAAEVVSVGTQKTVTADCVIIGQTATTNVQIDVVLIQNSGPDSVVFTVRDALTQAVLTDLTAVPKGTHLQYEAAVSDANYDSVLITWTFALSAPGDALPTTYTLYGPKVFVVPERPESNSTGVASGCRVTGSVTIYDRLSGGPLVQDTPVVVLV